MYREGMASEEVEQARWRRWRGGRRRLGKLRFQVGSADGLDWERCRK